MMKATRSPAPRRTPLPEQSPTPKPAARVKGLEQIVTMLASAQNVRGELVADIRSQMDGGAYMSEEKLNLAIYRMLRNILEEPKTAV